VQRLAEMGRWMKVNHDAIYQTTASPFKTLAFDGRCTVKGNKLYVHVFKWPADGLNLTGLKTTVRSARALEGNQPLEVKAEAGTLTIQKPSRLDDLATVLELTLAGSPEVVPAAE
jgi:alpha-L-fucosidase